MTNRVLWLRKWSIKGLVSVTCAGCLLVAVIEVGHYHSFGHFSGYGLHADLLNEPMSFGIPGVNSAYALQVANFSLLPITLEACQGPNDLSPYYDLTYRYQIERFETKSGKWGVFGMRMAPSDCQPPDWFHPKVVRLWPGQSEYLVDWEATAATKGLRKGDVVRFRVFCRFTEPDGSPNQRSVISSPFTLTEQCSEPEVKYRVKH